MSAHNVGNDHRNPGKVSKLIHLTAHAFVRFAYKYSSLQNLVEMVHEAIGVRDD